MKKLTDYSIELENHPTKDIGTENVNGSLSVIWRDWDGLVENEPKMVYVSSVNPNQVKGPHIHTKRTSYFTCIHGKVIFIIKEPSGNYLEIESSEDNPVMIIVPKNIATAHVNLSKTISRVLTLADIAWKPNDNEMINTTFNDYDWKKWNLD
ncbi:WxcM-like domain-containing protein [Nitrosopumilus sp.]|uniref:WxcM-like domain-containing protein n=1 Tax=Nitrosopumilus sp. TaxID=2024843 RepID=UPI0034A01E5E